MKREEVKKDVRNICLQYDNTIITKKLAMLEKDKGRGYIVCGTLLIFKKQRGHYGEKKENSGEFREKFSR